MGGSPSVPEEKLPAERTFIVTGGNTGIGYETAKKIAQLGGRVIIACRSEEKARKAIDKMKTDTQEEYTNAKNEKSDDVPDLNIQYMQLDLSSLDSTVQFARQYKESGLPLHVLICNAGMLGLSERTLTKADGFEVHFQVNYLSHFLLTILLLPLLKESSPNSRIINVSSMGHKFSECKVENMQGEKSYGLSTFYGNSKLFQIMNMHSLSRKLKEHDISIFSIHPGFVDTELFRTTTGFFRRCMNFLAAVASKNTTSGARTSLIAALDPKYKGKTALYFDGGKPATSNGLSRNQTKQDILWKYSLQCLRSTLSDIILQEIGEKLTDIAPLSDNKLDEDAASS